MMLKPQDTLLALKYWSIRGQEFRLSMRELAESIGISFGEISKSTKRLISAHLVVERGGGVEVEKRALLEWVNFGVRYAYPLKTVGYGRGLETSWNCPYLKSELVPPRPPIVWEVVSGRTEGILIKPIHSSVPFAASNDKFLYELLSTLEAIRGGKPRELIIARRLMNEMLELKVNDNY